jgi:hypothetical protein
MSYTIIDINKINKITGNNFIKKYKNKKLIIKDNHLEIKCKITTSNILFNNKKYYILTTDYDTLNPIFSIYFYDIINLEPSFENIYIDYISKKENIISGSDSVNLVIKICKKISNIKKLFLVDYATINCKKSNEQISLSLYKFITKKYTFYNKFGFKLYYNNKFMQSKLLKYSKIIGDYKVKNIIEEINNIVNFIENDYTNTIQYYFVDKFRKIIYNEYILSYDDKKYIIEKYNLLLHIFKKYKNYTFKNMINILIDKECYKLYLINNTLNDKTWFRFYNDNNNIISNFIYYFIELNILLNNYEHRGYYVKNL